LASWRLNEVCHDEGEQCGDEDHKEQVADGTLAGHGGAIVVNGKHARPRLSTARELLPAD
jgi:hypothetical protein